MRHGGLDLTPADQFYLTERQWKWADNSMTLVVRTKGDPAGLAPRIKQAIWAIDKDVPIAAVSTMTDLLRVSTAERRFALRLFAVFALVAVVLAAAGIYGALSGSVTERTRELGIRLALGAAPIDVLRMVIREGATLIGLGLVFGLTGAALLSRLLTALLYGVGPHDSLAQAVVALLFLAVGLLAALVPARRAARLDPIRTLRTE